MHSRTRKIIIWLFTTVAILAIAKAVHLSLNPDNYFFYGPEHRAKWTYQPYTVAFVCSFMLIEAALACATLVAPRPGPLWLRCILGLLLLAPWAFFSTLAVIHMPVYALFHHGWVWLLVLTLVVIMISSAIRQLYLRHTRKGPPNNSFKPNALRPSA